MLVEIDARQAERAHGPKRGLIKEIVGNESDPRAASILAMHTHGIMPGFTPDEEAQANAAKPAPLKGRVDLRQLPLITIDPEDARDHDDAVFAQPDGDAKNPGGWRVWVAIADVSHYVTPGSALDRGALRRGNSTYFPDRVAPMLPETLSADLCSLREGEERACLAVEMVFDADGKKRRHQFVRGLMRSAAKLSYEAAQAAIDGEPNEKTKPLLEPILKPLWAAYACVWKAPRGAPAARDRRARAQDHLQGRQGRRREAARALRRAQADRRIHDPGQCLRGGNAGAEEAARKSTASTIGRATRRSPRSPISCRRST